MLRGCLVCVICNSSSFHSFVFKLSILIHTLNMCTFDNIFWSFELRMYYVYTTFGVLTLCNLCVICIHHKQISFLYIQTLHNDCSHIEDVHRGHRSRAEFGLVILMNTFVTEILQINLINIGKKCGT